MKRLFLVALVGGLPLVAFAQSADSVMVEDPALLPLPEELRAGAGVLGYDDEGALVIAREGAGPMVCLSDDPSRDGFHVACYHRDLEPFMTRGRELRKAGMERDELVEARGREISEGLLAMPSHPAALYSVTGPEGCYDAVAGTLCETRRLYVVYIPFATQESTGLSTEATRGSPWLMNPGKPWAHIMMIPPE